MTRRSNWCWMAGCRNSPASSRFSPRWRFLYFAQADAQIAVLEVGMGGRLDATNVVDPLLSVITDISLDHTEWLGSTIAAIAREKAGILRSGGTLITLPQHPEANQVLGEVAAGLEVRVVSAAPYMPPCGAGAVAPYSVQALGAAIEVDSPLVGNHQHRNLALAIAAAVELAGKHGFPVTPAGHRRGHPADPLAGTIGAHPERRRGMDSGRGAQSRRSLGPARRLGGRAWRIRGRGR